MPKINKPPKSELKHRRWGIIVVPILAYVLLLGFLTRGKNMAIINPKGFVAGQQHNLLLYSVLIMLILAIPTLLMIYFTAWKYRDTNKQANYEPRMHHGKLFNMALWLVPASFILLLAAIMIPATHQLEPRKALAEDRPAMTIQVVALRWKWLFIYPDQRIATVNYVELPVNTPVQFELTADDAPMSSFWIPNFGGQLYAMTGHVNRLNLMADVAGDYPGKAAEINGAGFTGMKFIAHATDQPTFDQWVRNMRNSPMTLDQTTYKKLLEPTENNKPVMYKVSDPNLYDEIVAKYNTNHSHHE